jgi:hypothetical protein
MNKLSFPCDHEPDKKTIDIYLEYYYNVHNTSRNADLIGTWNPEQKLFTLELRIDEPVRWEDA